VLQHSPLADEFDLIPISTYRDGSMLDKALQAIQGLTALARLCGDGRIDLVHVHTFAGASLARKSLSIAVARVGGIPVVLHVHGGPDFHAGSGQRAPLARLQRRALRWALESSDAVVALTQGWDRSLAAYGRIRHSRVIPNAPELSAPIHRTDAARRRLVLFLGHLDHDKGVYDLLEAFARLDRSRSGLRLVFAGEGREAQGLRDRAGRLGLRGAVEMPGWVDPHVKAELLGEAVCLVLPSRHEGLPLALLEAMIAGVPVIATPVGGVPDCVDDGRSALLVPPGDVDALAGALERLVEEPELAAALSEAAQSRALVDYTPAALAARISSLYREVLARR
jgi:glycosyltransferase involved in cell wall biosynthesis